jgi:molybdate transport system regulatory protein
VLSDNRIRLLEAIDRCDSLNRSSREVPLSYKAAWEVLDVMNNLAPDPLVERSTGGCTKLTEYAHQLIHLYRAMERSQQDILDRIGTLPARTAHTDIRRLAVKTSACNQFSTQVIDLLDRGGVVDVVLGLDGQDGSSQHLIATVTPESVENLELRPGSEVFELIKAPVVQVTTTAPHRLDGCNVLADPITVLRTGERSLHAVLDLPKAEVSPSGSPSGLRSTGINLLCGILILAQVSSVRNVHDKCL